MSVVLDEKLRNNVCFKLVTYAQVIALYVLCGVTFRYREQHHGYYVWPQHSLLPTIHLPANNEGLQRTDDLCRAGYASIAVMYERQGMLFEINYFVRVYIVYLIVRAQLATHVDAVASSKT